MKHGKTLLVFSLLWLGLALFPSLGAAQTRYLKYNIVGYQENRGGDILSSYAAWIYPKKNRIVIPVNTAVTQGRWKYGFMLTKNVDKRRILFKYNLGRMRIPVQDYINMITSPTQVSLKHFSKRDMQGIRKAKPFLGMTKEGVLTALGYPATHRTPSLEATTWYYWKNRFATMGLVFDANGKMIEMIR